jgi:hypothetical protein
MSNKLILGTANFAQHYNGFRVPDSEQDRIWGYCRKAGIDIIDTAEAYGGVKIPEDFKVITKIGVGDIIHLPSYWAILAHNVDVYPVIESLTRCCDNIGVSIYEWKELPRFKVDIVQLPYKPFKKKLHKLKRKGMEVHVRKVFADDCYIEALRDKNVDKVVIGVDNLNQLKENVEIMRKEIL